MRSFQTINPATNEAIKTYTDMTPVEISKILDSSRRVFPAWRHTKPEERARYLARLADLMLAQAPKLARLATDEMGKPLSQAVKEVEKCALTCRHYAEHGPAMLADEPIPAASSRGVRSLIAYKPLGTVLGIMPWNFPYWQVIRFAAPTLAAGNTIILKHAESTTGVAVEIERLFKEAGFPEHVFQNLITNHDAIQSIIKDPTIKAISLTGSERAGASVAAAAGASLKKCVLELGGSDAYIVLRDADIETAAHTCVEARYVNSGQSCVAAKRFIIEAAIYERFVEAFVAKAKAKRLGNPVDPATDIGPLSRQAIAEGVVNQARASIQKGARALVGDLSQAKGCFVPVTVLDGVTPGMPAFDEEVFGPVAAMVRAQDEKDALRLANLSRYGLGGAIFSRDTARAERLAADDLEAGFVVVNGMVASDPRLPFGGIKLSGYGRELSQVGLREFVNVKTVVVNDPR